MGEVITVESGTQPVQGLPSGGCPDGQPSGDQQGLADQIRRLWAAHVEAKAAAKRAKAELRDIRKRLCGPLSEMKRLLAKPGRNGGWSSFLRSEGIAKATADRLARKREESSGTQPEGMPVPSPSISEPSGASASPSCGTGYGAAEAASPAPQVPEGGGANPASAPAADPAPQPPQGGNAIPAEASAAEPAPQPFCETPASVEQPAAETAATPTEAGQATAVADAGSESVQ